MGGSARALISGGDAAVHDLTRDLRGRSAEQRREGADVRVDAAAERDAVAQARDLAAAERDAAAELRDRALAECDAAWTHEQRAVTAAEIVLRAGEARKRAAADRVAAAAGRARAAAERDAAAQDRVQAARDRAQADADLAALLFQLDIAETDALTGARTRGAGLADLGREIARARHGTAQLVVIYVDIIGLKLVNDAQGHAAGDELIKRVVDVIRSHLRSYDLIVRLGGDEFLAVMSGAAIQDARRTFDAVEVELAGTEHPCRIRVGFAAVQSGDDAGALIARADAALRH